MNPVLPTSVAHCLDCGRTFKRSSHLKRHMVSHSDNPKPYQCNHSLCLMTFACQHHLSRHTRIIHDQKHSNTCEFCNETFPKKLSLVKHLSLKHNQPSPFVCSSCKRRFFTFTAIHAHSCISVQSPTHHSSHFSADTQSTRTPKRHSTQNEIPIKILKLDAPNESQPTLEAATENPTAIHFIKQPTKLSYKLLPTTTIQGVDSNASLESLDQKAIITSNIFDNPQPEMIVVSAKKHSLSPQVFVHAVDEGNLQIMNLKEEEVTDFLPSDEHHQSLHNRMLSLPNFDEGSKVIFDQFDGIIDEDQRDNSTREEPFMSSAFYWLRRPRTDSSLLPFQSPSSVRMTVHAGRKISDLFLAQDINPLTTSQIFSNSYGGDLQNSTIFKDLFTHDHNHHHNHHTSRSRRASLFSRKSPGLFSQKIEETDQSHLPVFLFHPPALILNPEQDQQTLTIQQEPTQAAAIKEVAKEEEFEEEEEEEEQASSKGKEKDEKSYKCTYSQCDKLYTKLSNLKTHVRTYHLKSKDFACNFTDCSAAYLHKKSLKEHIVRIHQSAKARQQQQKQKQAVTAIHPIFSSIPVSARPIVKVVPVIPTHAPSMQLRNSDIPSPPFSIKHRSQQPPRQIAATQQQEFIHLNNQHSQPQSHSDQNHHLQLSSAYTPLLSSYQPPILSAYPLTNTSHTYHNNSTQLPSNSNINNDIMHHSFIQTGQLQQQPQSQLPQNYNFTPCQIIKQEESSLHSNCNNDYLKHHQSQITAQPQQYHNFDQHNQQQQQQHQQQKQQPQQQLYQRQQQLEGYNSCYRQVESSCSTNSPDQEQVNHQQNHKRQYVGYDDSAFTA